jgi:hypothetical protein
MDYNIHRIAAALKVETDIITTIAASPIGRTGMLVIMYVETHIVFIGNSMCAWRLTER